MFYLLTDSHPTLLLYFIFLMGHSTEIHWYTWFIDFYLEGGLMRDVFTHEMTIPDQWHMLTTRTNHNSKNSLKYSNFITNITDGE